MAVLNQELVDVFKPETFAVLETDLKMIEEQLVDPSGPAIPEQCTWTGGRIYGMDA
jgi:hypothetical protein